MVTTTSEVFAIAHSKATSPGWLNGWRSDICGDDTRFWGRNNQANKSTCVGQGGEFAIILKTVRVAYGVCVANPNHPTKTNIATSRSVGDEQAR